MVKPAIVMRGGAGFAFSEQEIYSASEAAQQEAP
jgi:hypothetical protein